MILGTDSMEFHGNCLMNLCMETVLIHVIRA